jgi:hypothetical protein
MTVAPMIPIARNSDAEPAKPGTSPSAKPAADWWPTTIRS